MTMTRFAALLLLLSATACSRATRSAGGEHAGHDAAPAGEMAHRDEPGEMVRHNRHFLMSTDSLAARLDRRGTIVIHVGRGDSAYLAGHVPGARFLPLSAVAVTAGGVPNEFPPMEQMRRAFEALQIGDSNRVVIYGDDLGLLAARAWIALDLLGQADRAALLDGGLVKWRAENRRVDTGPVATTAMFVPFTARPRPDRVVNAEWVRARLGDSTVLLVDARTAGQYTGAEEPPCPAGQASCPQIPAARRGHIPMARNLFWQDALVAADNPVLKPMHLLHHALWQPAGADQPHVRTIVTYCRTGLMSSHAYFVARYVGYPDVRLYDGSFIEWSAKPASTHPVVRLQR